jgi:hypothetical protein
VRFFFISFATAQRTIRFVLGYAAIPTFLLDISTVEDNDTIAGLHPQSPHQFS